jgi:hypothetical protein
VRYRKLRIAWSVVWGIAAVLLVVLWVRSYRNCDQCWGHFPNGTTFEIDSISGYVWAGIVYWNYPSPLMLTTSQLSKESEEKYANLPKFRFMEQIGGSGLGTCVFAAPHWFLIILALGVAAVSWAPWRFSLRTLLIATMLVAVGLGLIAWLR